MIADILMSTYNGERYITEQIQSIQQQHFKQWRLWIRDDGSQDNTRAIIEQFAKQDSRIALVTTASTNNIGVVQSFYELKEFALKQEQIADYFFFCDQDDVWLPNKLQVCIERAELESKDVALAVYTDLSVVDSNLQTIHKSMIQTQSNHPNTTLASELTENTVTGGTLMINRTAATLWNTHKNLLMHDWYLALMCATCGKLVYVDEITELYRQHEDNVLGARSWQTRLRQITHPFNFFNKFWKFFTDSQLQAKELLHSGIEICDEDRTLLTVFTQILDYNTIQRIRAINKFGLRKNRLIRSILYQALLITKIGYPSKVK
ncbi:MAG: glycosyltransferase family 2 protein [Bifidobacteriaceae bacterium]|nr:glycosyltransferase family 2 protein [Bifidobacteriaceae bacterium]